MAPGPRYRVIMLDENMGEGKMKGTEVTRKIRDWPGRDAVALQ